MCSVAKPEPRKFLKAMGQLILFYTAVGLIVGFGMVMHIKREAATVPHSLKPADYVPMKESSDFRGSEFDTFHSSEGYYSPKRTGVPI